MRTRADVTVRRGDQVQQAPGVLLVQTPASLRFEALSPFGSPFLLLTVADETLTFYQVAENRALVGPATGDATRRWLGIPLEAEDLVGIVIGRLAPPRELREAELLPDDGAGPSLRLVGPRQRQRVWLDPETGEIRKIEIGSNDKRLTVEYERTSAGDLPDRLQARAAGFEASLEYQAPELSTGIDPARFTLGLPEGATVQRFY